MLWFRQELKVLYYLNTLLWTK